MTTPHKSGYSGALLGAYLKGCWAREAEESADKNPYEDKRTDNGKVTFSRAFQRAWYAGWQEVELRRGAGKE